MSLLPSSPLPSFLLSYLGPNLGITSYFLGAAGGYSELPPSNLPTREKGGFTVRSARKILEKNFASVGLGHRQGGGGHARKPKIITTVNCCQPVKGTTTQTLTQCNYSGSLPKVSFL